MAIPALDTTIGGAAANTYVTLAEADTYLDSRLNSVAWVANADDKTRALLEATRRMNELNWMGNRVTVTQRLAWPRWGVNKVDSAAFAGGYHSFYGNPYLTTEIPQPVKDAQCEWALALLEGFTGNPDAAMESFTADGLSVKFRDQPTPGSLPDRVSQLLGGLITGNMLVRA